MDTEISKKGVIIATLAFSMLLLGAIWGTNLLLNRYAFANDDDTGDDDDDSVSDSNLTSTTSSSDINETDSIDFQKEMRFLWSEHSIYTRQFIVDTAGDLESVNQTTERLLQNQEDLGNAIKPYYGEDAGNQLTDLLKQHIVLAAEIVNDAKAGNDSGVRQANTTWFQNADDIASFLAQANPQWDEDELKSVLHEHLHHVTDQAVARLQGDYDADIQAFDEGHRQVMELADTLSEGIIAQFPDKFDDHED